MISGYDYDYDYVYIHIYTYIYCCILPPSENTLPFPQFQLPPKEDPLLPTQFHLPPAQFPLPPSENPLPPSEYPLPPTQFLLPIYKYMYVHLCIYIYIYICVYIYIYISSNLHPSPNSRWLHHTALRYVRRAQSGAYMWWKGLNSVKMGSKRAKTTCLSIINGPGSLLEKRVFDPFLPHCWSQNGTFSRHFGIFHGPKRATKGSKRPRKNTCLSIPSGLGTTLEKTIFFAPGTPVAPPLAPTVRRLAGPPAAPSDH